MPTSNENNSTLVLPRTPAEELVAALYANLLGVENVTVYDVFFSLGGNHQLATRVLQRVRAIFRVNIGLRDFVNSPTVDGLVNKLSQMWDGREIVDEIAWAFMQVEELPEHEVSSMLKEKTKSMAGHEFDDRKGNTLSTDRSRLFELLLDQAGISLEPLENVLRSDTIDPE